VGCVSNDENDGKCNGSSASVPVGLSVVFTCTARASNRLTRALGNSEG